MKRRIITLCIALCSLMIALIALQLPVAARPSQQSGQTVRATQTARPLQQPMTVTIQQQIPLSLTIGATAPLTETATTTQTIPFTLELRLELALTNTQTGSVPSLVTLTLAGGQEVTAPITISLGGTPDADVAVQLIGVADELDASVVTATVELSPTTALTVPITTTISAVPPITATAIVTANLRIGPDTTFTVTGQLSPGQVVTVAAQNEGGAWYLLGNGRWVAAILLENLTGLPPIATEALIARLQAQQPISPTAQLTETVTPTATTAPITTTTPTTPTQEGTGPTLVATPSPQNVSPTVITDANLRSGPGTEFEVIGGTITDQQITIVARNAAGDWFKLDNGGWVAARLVANPPRVEDVPIEAEGSPAPPQAGVATPVPSLTPTATVTATETAPVFGVRENLYAIRVDSIVDRYNFALSQIRQLVEQARKDNKVVQDRKWVVNITTAITLLQVTGDEVTSLTAPALFTDAHEALVAAAAAYTQAADLLAESVDQVNETQINAAFKQIEAGNEAINSATDQIEALTP